MEVKPRYLVHQGRPTYLIGVNYWARSGGPLMWRHWQPEEVEAELRQMRELGMNTCRSFLYWPDFMPGPYTLDQRMLDRLDRFLELCRSADMLTIPSFFVGHMSGENWDVPWREGRDFYRDPWMLERERWYVREVAGRYRDQPALVGWLLSNEIPLYAGATSVPAAVSWTRAMVAAIREVDPSRPIGVGDGAWQAGGSDNGFALEPIAEVVDFLGPHVYPTEHDSLRHSYLPTFYILATSLGKPTLMEEFGCSTAHAGYQQQADYYRTTYHSVFANGGAGTLGWCYTDFDLPYQRPYSHHPFELLFGVTTVDGQAKPAGLEIKRFSALVERLDLAQVELPRRECMLVVPSYYREAYPFTAVDRQAMQRRLVEGLVLAKQGQLPVGLWWEPTIRTGVAEEIMDPTPVQLPECRLLLLPHEQAVTAPTAEALVEFAANGGTVYWSYHHPLWIHNCERLFGAIQHLRYGLAEAPGERLELRFLQPLGSIGEGTTLQLAAGGSLPAAGFCPLTPREAQVVAVDGAGRPALLAHRIGAGQVVFCTYPLEYYCTLRPEEHGGDGSAEGRDHYLPAQLYRALRELAGVQVPFDNDNRFVETVPVGVGPGRYWLWLINHSWGPTEGTITPAAPLSSALDAETGRNLLAAGGIDYRLEAKQVLVVEIGLAG